MAYMNQETKKEINAELKKVKKAFEKQGGYLKYSLAVRHYSTIVLNIRECSIDLAKNWMDNVNKQRSIEDVMVPTDIQVNHYHLDSAFDGEALKLLTALNTALHKHHWDDSDSMTDYFSCAYYVDINIGTWDKPFITKEI